MTKRRPHLHNEFGKAIGTSRRLAGHASVLYNKKLHKRASAALQEAIEESIRALELLRELAKKGGRR